MVYVLDTHALVWFLEGNEKLGRRALKVLRDSSETLVVPTIVLAEMKYLSVKGRTHLFYDEIVEAIERDSRCVIYPLDSNVVEMIPTSLDIHDGIICGTALVYVNLLGEKAKVVTRDSEIEKSGQVETIW